MLEELRVQVVQRARAALKRQVDQRWVEVRPAAELRREGRRRRVGRLQAVEHRVELRAAAARRTVEVQGQVVDQALGAVTVAAEAAQR